MEAKHIQQTLERDAFSKIKVTQAACLKKNCDWPDVSVLKLKIANLSSQNLNLKRKVEKLEETLKTNQNFEVAFNNAIKMTRALLEKQGLNSSISQQQLIKLLQNSPPKRQSLSSIKKDMLDTRQSNEERQLQSAFVKGIFSGTDQKKVSKNRLESYQKEQHQEVHRQREENSGETVKSLDFSMESKSSLESQQTKKQARANEIQELRKEYQRAKQNFQAIYNVKIRLLNQQLTELRNQNKQLRSQVKQYFEQQQKEQSIYQLEEFDNPRQTAYFPGLCETIIEQEQEESLGENSVDKSVSNEQWVEIIEQMRPVKNTLEKVHDMLKQGSAEILGILESFYELRTISKKVKMISLEDYLSLIQAKKKSQIEMSRCSALQSQIAQLKQMIKQFV